MKSENAPSTSHNSKSNLLLFNLFAVMVHCHRRGAEAIVGDLSHIFLYEQGKHLPVMHSSWGSISLSVSLISS